MPQGGRVRGAGASGEGKHRQTRTRWNGIQPSARRVRQRANRVGPCPGAIAGGSGFRGPERGEFFLVFLRGWLGGGGAVEIRRGVGWEGVALEGFGQAEQGGG